MHIAGLPNLSGAAARKLERLQAAAEGAQHDSLAARELAAFVSTWQATGADPSAIAEAAEAEERAAAEAAVAAAEAAAEAERAAKAKTTQPKGPRQ
jgi:hypothetical protein